MGHPNASSKTALITGITGQDGSYLTEFLLAKSYRVFGIIRRSSVFTTERIDHLYQDRHEDDIRMQLLYGDVLDPLCLRRVLGEVQPDEVYNLAAQSHVRTSFDQPAYTSQVVALGTLHLLDAIREYQATTGRTIRFYQASSSEMFGNARAVPQSEETPLHPRSPYACAKVHAHHLTINYREAYGLFACSGILFNHESPRRGETFVTRKITRAATRIKLGLQNKLYLGHLDAKRDWGYAGDYVRAMWLMLQQEDPDDFVVATGESHSVRELVQTVFERLDLDWQQHVAFDDRYLRPTEVNLLQGDSRKARNLLGWQPEVNFDQLVDMMIESDLQLARQEQTLVEAGFTR